MGYSSLAGFVFERNHKQWDGVSDTVCRVLHVHFSQSNVVSIVENTSSFHCFSSPSPGAHELRNTQRRKPCSTVPSIRTHKNQCGLLAQTLH